MTEKKLLLKEWKDVPYWMYFVVGSVPREIDLEVKDDKVFITTKKLVKFEGQWDISRLKIWRRGTNWIVKINDVSWIEGSLEE